MDYLRGTVMHYPWGTHDAIADLVGIENDGRPLAEWWLGAHPLSPSPIGDSTLDAVVTADPRLLGDATVESFGPRLPFLMKILSARHALSLQAHPSREQAEEGFAAEEALGIPRDAPERTYRDDWPKPELLVALDDFHSLLGFRNPFTTWGLFHDLGVQPETLQLFAPLHARGGEAALQEVFLEVLAIDDSRRGAVDDVLSAARAKADAAGAVGEFARTALEIDEVFPGDPGILAALLMNRIVLREGEAVYVPAGTMHAHLRGTGVEVMASSDNVLRGGLTTKHIAVDELVRVVDFRWRDQEVLTGEAVAPGVLAYPTHCDEFDVWRLDPVDGTDIVVPADGHARIALVTRGSGTFTSTADTIPVERGQSVFLAATDAGVVLRGDAQVFLAAPGLESTVGVTS